ncbi:DUF5719 family protein [Actinacidiphila yeochonensis]|uniref:DUF5719 family protein n=1 Tax=Actinacidiphila yeochonensis TaxID=89050 RepID=UPI00056BB488|nr:DUF5719 family protein [Actinacidiphila yeochonensis]
MNRSTISLAGAVVALAVLTGIASAAGGSSDPAPSAGTAARLPVQHTTLLCPEPSPSELPSTTYTSFTPQGTDTADSGAGSGTGSDAAASGAATLVPATDKPRALKPLKAPGKPVTYTNNKPGAPALIGAADGSLAPGWTVQQTTVVDDGPSRGLLATSCTEPDTEFWFPGASTADGRQDYVHLVNPDDTPAVVDVELYGADGALKTPAGDGITVPGKSSKPVLLSTLTASKAADVTVHVVARSGRVGAAVQATATGKGSDWLPAAAPPAGSLVMPGIPADATDVRLTTFATGSDDADLTLKLATSGGSIVPAGHETLHVKSGMTMSVDLGDITKGEAGSLLLGSSTTHAPVPVVAALLVTRGKGASQDLAFIPATSPVGARATVADNRAKGSTLGLTAVGSSAQVRITSSAGSGGGTAATRTVTVKAGATLSIAPPVPSGLKGSYAVTVQHLSGGTVYASRMLALPDSGVPMFTIQSLSDDRSTVAVPSASSDLRILEP